MSRIFLDVGANTGQTLAAVLPYAFDQIVCFEPTKVCLPQLKAVVDPRVKIEPFGLWDKCGWFPLYEPGLKGASLWRKDKARSDTTELCQFHSASKWFKYNIQDGDRVFLKLNCEGAECDILDDLLDSGEFKKVAYVMIDFDVRKISSEKHREAEVKSRLAGIGFPRVSYSKQVMIGPTHQARIQNWLHWTN